MYFLIKDAQVPKKSSSPHPHPAPKLLIAAAAAIQAGG
jgi:hypothetical protein